MRLAEAADECVITDGLQMKKPYGIVSLERSLDELKRDYSAEVYYTAQSGYICRNGEKFFAFSDIRIREKHNILNFMTALATADGYIGKSDAVEVARSFKGLPHRCQLIAKADGVEYYDSSIDSTPTRTEATLTALDRRVVIILGGRGKGLDYSIMLDSLRKYAAKIVITGENSQEIYSAVKELHPVIIEDFEEAILNGAELAKNVGALLLSPASTSYDRFKNYAERGYKFKEIVLKRT
jgi:UDP-N-acetylmuramoylalanine--D-glutamate ligase